jgi:hypothetical protein
MKPPFHDLNTIFASPPPPKNPVISLPLRSSISIAVSRREKKVERARLYYRRHEFKFGKPGTT